MWSQFWSGSLVGGLVLGAKLLNYTASSGEHGFLRAVDGTIRTFDVPGTHDGTYATSVNGAGTVVGYHGYYDDTHHGYLRSS